MLESEPCKLRRFRPFGVGGLLQKWGPPALLDSCLFSWDGIPLYLWTGMRARNVYADGWKLKERLKIKAHFFWEGRTGTELPAWCQRSSNRTFESVTDYEIKSSGGNCWLGTATRREKRRKESHVFPIRKRLFWFKTIAFSAFGFLRSAFSQAATVAAVSSLWRNGGWRSPNLLGRGVVTPHFDRKRR